ncbi:hypothetical protein Cgig2_009971 [Carnegiea gigantea]|uniref:Nucleotidyl transferase domain-containing protein n=1 Tax=Carnegiea gigantea TaxID=171969 RepID=A0A9Q1GUV7_9CARY|nr:hypothetical protein Cgig2_009971 [Carnegiea gigantea]
MIGTRFRPLSVNIPKPPFPLAGQPMVHHPILACNRIPNLAQIYLVGFYEEREFALCVSSISNELRVPILEGRQTSWFCWWAVQFQDTIMEDSPSQIFLLNFDVCCSFPLPEMPDAHRRYRGMGTILVSKVSAESASQFGELVANTNTNEVWHYTEKPETLVRDKINCGVYVLTPEIFNAIQDVSTHRKDTDGITRCASSIAECQQMFKSFLFRSLPSDFVRLDQDEVVVIKSIVLPNMTLKPECTRGDNVVVNGLTCFAVFAASLDIGCSLLCFTCFMPSRVHLYNCT